MVKRKAIARPLTPPVPLGEKPPGVFLVSDDMPIGHAIDELLIAAHCLTPEECKDIVEYLPM